MRFPTSGQVAGDRIAFLLHPRWKRGPFGLVYDSIRELDRLIKDIVDKARDAWKPLPRLCRIGSLQIDLAAPVIAVPAGGKLKATYLSTMYTYSLFY